MRLPITAVIAAAALLGASRPVGAQEPGGLQRVLVATLTGALPGPLATVPERLSIVLTGVVDESERGVTRAGLDDVLGLAGCGEATDPCLQEALGLLEVDALILGDVEEVPPGRVRIRVRLIAAGRPARARAFVLAAGDLDALADEFRARVRPFWRDPDAPELSPRAPEPPSPALPVEGADAEAGFSASRVHQVTWMVTGAGAGLMLAGGLLVLAGRDKQSQINDAPTDTRDDLQNLADLEEDGQRYYRLGTVSLVVGTVAAAAGIALIYRQGTERPDPITPAPRPSRFSFTLAPTVVGDSLGAALTVRGEP